MNKDEIVLAVCIALMIFLTAFGVFMQIRQQKTNRETQRIISDQDLLRLINDEPDQLISPHQLRDKTELTINEARTRLNSLMMFGVLNRSTNRSGRHFFSLQEPLAENPNLTLSSDPFLTVEDLLDIFSHYNYRVTPQQLIMATGLPMNIIKREMKYFENQKIVQRLQRADANGGIIRRFYVLQDPYRSDPERFRAKASQLDLEMKEILRNDNLLV